MQTSNTQVLVRANIPNNKLVTFFCAENDDQPVGPWLQKERYALLL